MEQREGSNLISGGAWLGSAITGATALIAAYLGILGSALQTRRQLRVEKMKQIEQSRDKKFSVYNTVLEADGRYNVWSFDFSGPGDQFNILTYREQIRPKMFDGFHLLDDDVRQSARALDRELAAYDVEFTLGNHPVSSGDALTIYTEMIERIEKHYEEYR